MNQRASHAKVRRALLVFALVVALVVALGVVSGARADRRRIGLEEGWCKNKRLEKVSKIVGFDDVGLDV